MAVPAYNQKLPKILPLIVAKITEQIPIEMITTSKLIESFQRCQEICGLSLNDDA